MYKTISFIVGSFILGVGVGAGNLALPTAQLSAQDKFIADLKTVDDTTAHVIKFLDANGENVKMPDTGDVATALGMASTLVVKTSVATGDESDKAVDGKAGAQKRLLRVTGRGQRLGATIVLLEGFIFHLGSKGMSQETMQPIEDNMKSAEEVIKRVGPETD